jgi:hypothetical protein
MRQRAVADGRPESRDFGAAGVPAGDGLAGDAAHVQCFPPVLDDEMPAGGGVAA